MKTQTAAALLILTYTASVLVDAGWRSVEITATAKKTSEKMAVVTEVQAIDGEPPSRGASRTGANRQKYNGVAIAKREVGKLKRLSACNVAAA